MDHKILDKVWVMHDNRPTQFTIFAIEESISVGLKKTYTTLRLINNIKYWSDNMLGRIVSKAVWLHRRPDTVYSRKQDLLDSFLAQKAKEVVAFRYKPQNEQPKACPFCKQTPDVIPADPMLHGSGWGGVKCNDEKCPVNPSHTVYDLLEHEEESSDNYKQAAIREWNVALGGR